MNVATKMRAALFGQDAAIDLIEQQLAIYNAGLSDPGRPAGVFALYGPTGSGKTHTVEALAAALHGRPDCYLRVDCGEMQLDHEISKMTGSPPGFLGHKETIPIINSARLALKTTDKCDLSLLLFDEIEKGAKSLHRLMLGILDKSRLNLSDNTSVSFDKTIIFMTSNAGVSAPKSAETLSAAIPAHCRAIGDKDSLSDVFSPEFLNRIDAFIEYKALTAADLERILALQVDELQARIVNKLADDAFVFCIDPIAQAEIIRLSDTPRWGARELMRVFRKKITTVVANAILYNDPKETSRGKVTMQFNDGNFRLWLSEPTLEELVRASLITAEWRKRKNGN